MRIDDSQDISNSIASWLQEIEKGSGRFAELLRTSDKASSEGFRHTIREICQQPVTWCATAHRLTAVRDVIATAVAAHRRIVMTGSGSSQYVGECAAPALERYLGRTVEVAGGGDLLLKGRASVAGEPTLVVSLARSGDSPESAAVVDWLLNTEPTTRHMVITCNAAGKLLKKFAGDERVRGIALGPEVNDRSLVMTSSFTNLVLGARFLGWVDRTDQFVRMVDRLDHAARQILLQWPDRLGAWIAGDVERIVFLGTGSRFGSCLEASLKVLEMTAGKVTTMAQTYLGLRHGPMSYLNERSLVVCFLSSDPLIRSYERDLIQELNAKGLGARKLVVGIQDPGAGLCQGQDLAIPYEVPEETADDDLTILDVTIAQILGFHRCMEEGLQPDSPSHGVITRVVGEFRIHHAAGAVK